jgi:hypothetical protein
VIPLTVASASTNSRTRNEPAAALRARVREAAPGPVIVTSSSIPPSFSPSVIVPVTSIGIESSPAWSFASSIAHRSVPLAMPSAVVVTG